MTSFRILRHKDASLLSGRQSGCKEVSAAAAADDDNDDADVDGAGERVKRLTDALATEAVQIRLVSG